ncbi:hypothetical protein PROFUN_10393, partial [Planoprotostelium fungivorum]
NNADVRCLLSTYIESAIAVQQVRQDSILLHITLWNNVRELFQA